MNNTDALTALVKWVNLADSLVRTSNDPRVLSELRNIVFEINLVVGFEGVAETLLAACLETFPEDKPIRRELVGQLVAMGRLDDAHLIESGSEPPKVGVGSDREIDQLGAQVLASAESAKKMR